MQKNQKQAQAQARIEGAIVQCRKPISPDLVDVFTIIENWFAMADHEVPHIYGTASFPLQEPRPILTAAVIGIDAMPGLVIRCLDGCYRLGQPASLDDAVQTVGQNRHKGRIAWPRFKRMVDDFVLKLSDAKDGIC